MGFCNLKNLDTFFVLQTRCLTCRAKSVGDIRSLSTLKRELRIRQSRLDKVLHGYGLFVCNGNTFYSPKLNEVMKPFEQRRVRIEAYKRQKEKENLLEISGEAPGKSDIVSFA